MSAAKAATKVAATAAKCVSAPLKPGWQYFTAGCGTCAGSLSALTGLGGAVVFVPTCSKLGMTAKKIVGTTVVAVTCATTAGSYAYASNNVTDIPAAIAIGVVGAATTPFGQMIAKRISGKTLRKWCGGALLMCAPTAFVKKKTHKPVPGHPELDEPEGSPIMVGDSRPGGAAALALAGKADELVAKGGILAYLNKSAAGLGGVGAADGKETSSGPRGITSSKPPPPVARSVDERGAIIRHVGGAWARVRTSARRSVGEAGDAKDDDDSRDNPRVVAGSPAESSKTRGGQDGGGGGGGDDATTTTEVGKSGNAWINMKEQFQERLDNANGSWTEALIAERENFLIGLAVGMIQGTVGVGGGVLVTTYMSMFSDMEVHRICATALMATLVTNTVVVTHHLREGNVRIRVAAVLGATAMAASYVTAKNVSLSVPETAIRGFIASALVASGASMLR